MFGSELCVERVISDDEGLPRHSLAFGTGAHVMEIARERERERERERKEKIRSLGRDERIPQLLNAHYHGNRVYRLTRRKYDT